MIPNLQITRNDKGQHALNKVLSLAAALVLSMAFIKEAGTNTLEWLDYIGYSCGMALSYAPAAVAKVIAAMRGIPEQTPPAAAPSSALEGAD